jgi:Pre-mRNA 3'-end-processing endonuclease polyadenylation factor C-term
VSIKTGLKKGVATVEWQASPSGDVIADSIVSLLMHAQSSAASIRLSSKPCRHYSDAELGDDDNKSSKKIRDDVNELVESRLRFVHGLLKDQFREVDAVYEANKASFEILTDSGLESTPVGLDEDGKLKCSVSIEVDKDYGDKAKIVIECQDQKLASNIQKTLKNALSTFDRI